MTPVVDTTNQDIPMTHLEDFAKIIHDLSQVFDLDNNVCNTLFNIFWHPDDPHLMGFNRNRLIFLNLAHYARERMLDFISIIESADLYHP
jgi:hypothetical protein